MAENLFYCYPLVRPTELEKNTPPSYFAVVAWTSNFIFYFYKLLQCSGRVQSKNGVDLVQVSIFYKSEKTSSQTVQPKKIKKTVALLYLIMAA